MPADDGFGAHDDDRVEHRAEDASGESEQHAILRMNAGLWHGTTQDDDLLAKGGISVSSAARVLKAERSVLRTIFRISRNIAAQSLARGDYPKNPGKTGRWFDLVPTFCGALAAWSES